MDTTAAIHGDDIIAEGEPEKMDRLDERDTETIGRC